MAKLPALPRPATAPASRVALALPRLAGLLVVLLSLEVGEDPGLLYLPLETAKYALEIVAFVNRDLDHYSPNLRPDIGHHVLRGVTPGNPKNMQGNRRVSTPAAPRISCEPGPCTPASFRLPKAPRSGIAS